MTKEEREAVIVGGVSGTLPLIINFLSIDAHLILDHFSKAVFVGYSIKVSGLMLLGAFLVFVNKEVELRKAFQIGVMAPAIVIGMLNANNLDEANKEIVTLEEQLQDKNSTVKFVPATSSYAPFEYTKTPSKPVFSLFSAAHAQSRLKGEHGRPSPAKRIWYGATGNMTESWFVIVGSHKSKNSAKKQVTRLRKVGFNAKVYPPFDGNKYFGVMIGSYISLEKARRLKTQAKQAGLSDVYLWKWKP